MLNIFWLWGSVFEIPFERAGICVFGNGVCVCCASLVIFHQCGVENVGVCKCMLVGEIKATFNCIDIGKAGSCCSICSIHCKWLNFIIMWLNKNKCI